jgi:cytoskeletal protein CcmA (bactofilin family)
VEGTIAAQERCDLKATATVIGDITAGTLAVEEGATFSGSSKVGKGAGLK